METKLDVKMIKCAVCQKEIPDSESVKKLRGALIVCKDCAAKEDTKPKEGEVCEFC